MWGLSRDSKENDTFYGDCMVKLVWGLSDNLIHDILSIKLQTNYISSTCTINKYNCDELKLNHWLKIIISTVEPL